MQSKNQNKKNESRKLKIHPKFYSRTYKTVVYPEIRLSGKWLQEAGFTSGNSVQVDCRKNKIIITVLSKREGGKK
ncbi:MAG: SymE family type I addiction module toxin [Bacteroidota bacterium]